MRDFPPILRRAPAAPVALLVLAALAAPAPRAQYLPPDPERPEGVVVGRWILAPYYRLSFEDDDNLFRRNDDSEPIGDRILSNSLGIGARLPIRNSVLRIDYNLRRDDYETNMFDRDLSHNASVELEMQFSTFDTLTVSDSYIRSFSDTQTIDAGGELTFNGEPYSYNRWEIDLSRRLYARPGYTVRLSRTDLNYTGETAVPFFDYRGWDGLAEYRHPFAGRRSMVVQVRGRWFDQFNANTPDEVGIPFRKEQSSKYMVGIEGLWSRNQLYSLRIGYGRFDYELVESEPFGGVVGQAVFRKRLGGRTLLDFTLSREVLPSNFDTYYINLQLVGRAEMTLGHATTGGFRVLAGSNDYADPVGITGCESIRRADDRVQVQPYLQWLLHPRVGLEFTGTTERRTSNCEVVEYDYTSLGLSMNFGWF